MQTAVADQAHHRLAIAAPEPGTHGGGQGITQGAVTGGGIEPAAWVVEVQGQVAAVHRLSGVAHEHHAGQFLQNGVEKPGLRTRRSVPGRFQLGPQTGDACCTPVGSARRQRLAVDFGKQGLGGNARIGHQCHLGRVVSYGLVRVDIDAQQRSGNVETAGEGDVVVGLRQLGADRQYHVSFSHQGTGGGQCLRGADQQRVRGGQHTLGVNGQGHGRAEGFCEVGQFGGGVNGAATGQDQRALGRSQPLAHLLNGSRGCAGTGDADRRAAQQRVGIFHQHIQGDLDMHRARPTSLEQRKRPRQHGGQFGR